MLFTHSSVRIYADAAKRSINVIIKTGVVILGALIGALWPPVFGLDGLDPFAFRALGVVLGSVISGLLIAILSLFERGTPGMIAGGVAGFIMAAWLSMILNSLIFGGMSDAASTSLAADNYICVNYGSEGIRLGEAEGRQKHSALGVCPSW